MTPRLTDGVQGVVATPDVGDDLIWIGGPSEGPWVVVGLGEKAVDGGLKVDDPLEHAAFEPSFGCRALSRRRKYHAEPAEALVSFIAGCGVERDQRAGPVMIETAAPSLQRKRHPFCEQAVAVGRRDHPKI
jgi:hypothetical protein